MIFKYVLIFFLYILNKVLTETVPSKQSKSCLKLNVILFFAKSSFNLPKVEMPAMKMLEMHEVANVKSSFPGSRNFERAPDMMSKCFPSCKELLKESLTSLIRYCQNALGMKTAIASISNSQITNDISNEEPETPPEIREPLVDSQNSHQEIIGQEVNKKTPRHFYQNQFIPNPETENMRDVITSPEHTEVFKIRVKRQQLPEMKHNMRSSEIADVPLDKESKKPPWDVMDIMSHIRFSFFGKLFEDEAKKKISEEENKIADDLTPNQEDPGLFATVKTILSTLQEKPEEPFLMTIFGGHLSEICDSKSPLIQTIKHVTENTDPATTLIVLTGACPIHEQEAEHEHKLELGHEINRKYDPVQGPELAREHHSGRGYEYRRKRRHQRKKQIKREENVVHIHENGFGCRPGNDTMPVYARGPDYAKLSQCSLLFDVPVIVKSILEQMTPNFEGEESFQPRPKRSLFRDIRMNKPNDQNVGGQINENKSVISYICVIILFII